MLIVLHLVVEDWKGDMRLQLEQSEERVFGEHADRQKAL